MISIKDTIGFLWYPCPKCKKEQVITEWGEHSCVYEGCDRHKFIVEYNFETATLMLKHLQTKNQFEDRERRRQPFKRPARPLLQKVNGGYIAVQQPDSANPKDWYDNDPFKRL